MTHLVRLNELARKLGQDRRTLQGVLERWPGVIQRLKETRTTPIYVDLAALYQKAPHLVPVSVLVSDEAKALGERLDVLEANVGELRAEFERLG